jgi:HSP20 family protein
MRVRLRYVTYTTGTSSAQKQDMERMFHDLWHLRQPAVSPAGEWRPPTDVYETPDRLVVKMELAGVPEDHIEITLYADHLTVSGSRPDSQPSGERVAYREAQIHYGSFRAEVGLPRPVDGERVTASLDGGMLTIELPRLSDA